MKLFSNHRFITADLGSLKLSDALEKLTQEDFFKQNTSFYLVEKVNEQHIVFGTPRDRVTSSQIHAFEYNVAEKRISVTSKYNSIFFPGHLLYIYFIYGMYVCGTATVLAEWQTFLLFFVGITIYLLFCAVISLKPDAEMIERALTIRLNYLAKKTER